MPFKWYPHLSPLRLALCTLTLLETCTLRRSQLGPTTLEILQVLKHLYQQERLDFTTGILAKEEHYTIEGPVTESAVLELLKAGKEEELHELYTNWSIRIQSD